MRLFASTRVPVALLALGLAWMTACAPPPPPAPQPRLTHEAYVWQRSWTPAVGVAVREGTADFAALRVLVLQQVGEERIAVSPDLDALRERGLPLRAVLRIEGSRPRADAGALGSAMALVVQQWRAHGLHVDGVEVDHDCASAALADYADWLRVFQSELPRDLVLSITALPSWLEAPAGLGVLRDAADETVLQVHAVEAWRSALVDASSTLRWARAWQAQSARPFRIALPAYGLRVQLGRDGRPAAVDAEGAIDRSGQAAQERRADPVEVAAIVRALQAEPLPQLKGLLWFRLPVAGDRRSWAPATLSAAMRGEAPEARIELQAVARGGGLHDLVLQNVGSTDAQAPAYIQLPAHCPLVEGVGTYRSAVEPAGLKAAQPVWLAPGATLALGFARCGEALPAVWMP